MQEPLISVIVPVYKVEAYLDRCVQSIVDQTYKNLEIILVDDGSPDNCPAMCDAWAEKDSRIMVIHKENGGLSDARNAGIDIATGELIGFVDSDDWISPDMYQLLYGRLEADNSDISACGVEMVWEDGTPSRMLTKSGCCVLDREEAMQAIIEESWLKQPVWYKLYKTEQIRNISFPVGKYHEDVFWSYQAVAKARRVSVVDTPCYHYSQRTDSIMGAGYSLKRLDSLEAKQERLAFVMTHFPELNQIAYKDIFFSCIYAGQMTQRYLSGEDVSVAWRRIKRCFASIKYQHIIEKDLKQSVWFAFGKCSLYVTCKIRNLCRIGL